MLCYPQLYNSAGSSASRPVLLEPIIMSIVFEHSKQIEKLKSSIEKSKVLFLNWNNHLSINLKIKTKKDSEGIKICSNPMCKHSSNDHYSPLHPKFNKWKTIDKTLVVRPTYFS